MKPPAALLSPREAAYTTFNGDKLKLFAWSGMKVAILTRVEGLDQKVTIELCATFDGSYDFYREATGRDPVPAKQLDGRPVGRGWRGFKRLGAPSQGR